MLQEWDINISTLKNPLLWFQLIMVSFLGGGLFLLLLLVGLNLFEHHWEDIPMSFVISLTISGSLLLAFSLIVLLMFWRGIPTKYVLKDKYIEQHTLMRSKNTIGLLGILGILSGKNTGYTAVGASLLARSREQIAVEWKEVSKLEVFPQRNEIQLHNDWRTIMQVICPEDQFQSILHFIQQKTEKNKTSEKLKESEETIKTSFSVKIILSLLSLVFGIFLFPRLPIHYVGIFAIATIIFALLALWSSALKQRFFGGILFLLPLIGVVLAFLWGEVEMTQQGAIYALLIELVLLGFFLLLGLGVFFKKIN